jgi:hypothetical protein
LGIAADNVIVETRTDPDLLVMVGKITYHLPLPAPNSEPAMLSLTTICTLDLGTLFSSTPEFPHLLDLAHEWPSFASAHSTISQAQKFSPNEVFSNSSFEINLSSLGSWVMEIVAPPC